MTTAPIAPNLRLATLDDIPALRQLIQDSVRGLSTDVYTSEQIESALTHVFGVDTQLILDGTYFVAEIDDQLVASGGWSKRKTLFGGDQSKPDQVDELLNPTSDAARVRAFYVHPKWSRKGLGTRLIESCENAARDAGFRRIELLATLPGVPLYSANGYTIVRESPFETTGGLSLGAYVMSKEL